MNHESSNSEPSSGSAHASDSGSPHSPAQGEDWPGDGELAQNAILPEHVRVNQTEGTGVEITWKDGHASQWTFTWLRDACPCAMCAEERQATGRAPGEPKPQPEKSLPIYKPPLRPQHTKAVGNYAISFDWNDGHRSGIYSWRYLRSICTCPTCTAARS